MSYNIPANMPIPEWLKIKDLQIYEKNEFITNASFDLTIIEQRLFNFLLAKISRYDTEFKECEITVLDFEKLCGIHYNSGKLYKDIKKAIKALADKSIWYKDPSGNEILLRIIDTAEIVPHTGIIRMKLHSSMRPFFLDIDTDGGHFTVMDYMLVLRFASRYTWPLYSVIRKVHYHTLDTYRFYLSLDDIRKICAAAHYTTWSTLRQNVLDVAVKEINAYSEKEVSYQPYKMGRAFVGVIIQVSSKTSAAMLNARAEMEHYLGYDTAQMNLFGEMGNITNER